MPAFLDAFASGKKSLGKLCVIHMLKIVHLCLTIHSAHFSTCLLPGRPRCTSVGLPGLCLAGFEQCWVPSEVETGDSEEWGHGVYYFDFLSLFALRCVLSSNEVYGSFQYGWPYAIISPFSSSTNCLSCCFVVLFSCILYHPRLSGIK